MNKILSCILGAILLLPIAVQSQDLPVTLEGSQRQKLIESGLLGGGGGVGGAQTNAVNVWTSRQTFTSPVHMFGITNVMGTFPTGTNYFNGFLFMNTNRMDTTAHFMNFVQPVTSGNHDFNFNVGAGGTGIGLHIGDYYDTLGGGQKFGVLSFSTSANAVKLFTVGGSGPDVILGDSNQPQITLNADTVTLGVSASSTEVHNGSTFTYAHPANFNSGVLRLPTSTASGGITNESFIVSPAFFATNYNSYAPASLTATSTTATGVTNLIRTVNAGAGTEMSRFRAITVTNTFHTALTPTINVIYTNSWNQKAWVSAVVRLPYNATTNSSAALWTISAGQTNFAQGKVSSSAGVAAVTQNADLSVTGWVNPGDLFMISNMNAGAGAATLDPNGLVITLH